MGIGLQKLPDGRHQAGALLRQLDAVVTALQKRKADLPLQRVHHMGQSGLGVAHHLRSLGKAAQICRRHQNLQFLAVHLFPSFHIYYIFSYPYYKQAFGSLQGE